MPKRRGSRFVLEALFLAAVAAALTVGDPERADGDRRDAARVAARRAVRVGLVARGAALRARAAAAVRRPAGGAAAAAARRAGTPGGGGTSARPLRVPGAGDGRYGADLGRRAGRVGPGAWGEVLEDWPVLDSRAVGEDTEVIALDGLELESLFDELRAEEPPAEVPEAEAPEAEPTSELELSCSGRGGRRPRRAGGGPSRPGLPTRRPQPTSSSGRRSRRSRRPRRPSSRRPRRSPRRRFLPSPPLPPGRSPARRPPRCRPPSRNRWRGSGPVEGEPVDGEPAVPALALPVIAVGPVTARHRIDPLPNPRRGRFRRRRGRNDSPIVVVPARPPTTRVLPRGRREDSM